MNTFTIRKFGYNGDVDSSGGTDEDVIAIGGTQYFPSTVVAAADIDITSSDANDTAAGTGARTITIYGLDANYKNISETVSLSGLLAVNPVNDYLRIHRAEVLTAGSGNTAAGNITIADGTGTFAYIPVTHNQTLQAAYTIPNYGDAFLLSVNCNLITSAASAWITVALLQRSFGGVFQTKELFAVNDSTPTFIQYSDPRPIARRTDIKLRVVDASGLNLAVSGGFEVVQGF